MKNIFRWVLGHKKWVVGLLIVVGIFFGYRAYSASKKPPQVAYEVKRGTVAETLSLSGLVDARQKVDLQFQTAGMLTWVGVKPGDRVKKYQTVATLDSRQIKKMIDKYLNSYFKTRLTFEQNHQDNKDYEVSGLSQAARDTVKRTLQSSQADLNNAVTDVEIQDLALQFSRLYTPIEGIVTAVDVPYAGVNIIPAQATIEVVNPATIYFLVTADQSEIMKVVEGEKAVIVLDAYPEQQLEGKITTVGYIPKKGETSTDYEVDLDFQGATEAAKYKLGMTGDATFVLTQKDNVLFLPSRAVKSDPNGKYVLMGNDKHRVYLTTGIDNGDQIEVGTDQLKEGDVVYD